mmetsp:Transcript_855/g.855  ORF Transcript_855/g.855 Transcript_855/m.855 type:complete len:82 (+) Transcript_855:521-766(+)
MSQSGYNWILGLPIAIASNSRRFESFSILKDHSRLLSSGGKINKGKYSDGNEYDKVSESSANSEVMKGSRRSGSSHSSGNR